NNLSDIPSGIPGVETMLPLLINHVLEKKITLQSVIEKTVINPSNILGIKPPGFAKGSPADFALYPKEPVKISADNLFSKAGWTPYEEMSAVFPDITVVSGNIAYNRGEFFKGFARPFRGNGYKTL
ncbi:MAG: dihydroorotase, partial [Methanomicrobium sp.]|nr:dihydroorotase [Methanomicrobium sp.]